ncbi:16S rRNA (uracil(1498)-N(3))-methyltransferase [bacterium]|nr:MAG: 16S rRNA (uracil(1498)-N(3))-methyltransferase [bacterium]
MPLRALPRVFVPGATAEGEIELPPDELDKLRKVLRLASGAEIGVLPNDGTLIRARLDGRVAQPIGVEYPDSESELSLTILQALPKGDKAEEIVRACTEIGVTGFVFFASRRTIVRWDEAKTEAKLQRLRTIAKESCELSFRTRVPKIGYLPSLDAVLKEFPSCVALSEAESTTPVLTKAEELLIGPEGGWAPDEQAKIAGLGVTLGPRVLRVEHAGPAAAAILLLRHG